MADHAGPTKSPDNIDVEAENQVSVEIDADDDENDLDNNGPPVPELPDFVDRVTVNDLSPELLHRLALSLDLTSSSHAFKNWEWLAHELGVPGDEIRYLRERAQFPASPTKIVLQRYGKEILGRVLRIIRDILKRFDVIIQILPGLFALEEYSRLEPSGDKAGAMAKGECSSLDKDSGVFPSAPINESLITASNAAAAAAASSVDADNHDATILVTYCARDPLERRMVSWLCKNLQAIHLRVVQDETLSANASGDWTASIVECFNKARAVIIVCSSDYLTYIVNATAAPDHDHHWQCSRFLYQLMCTEYRQYNCQNRRFRPVTFGQLADEHTVPSILRNTVIYRWPKQNDDLMRSLVTVRSYLKTPSMGLAFCFPNRTLRPLKDLALYMGETNCFESNNEIVYIANSWRMVRESNQMIQGKQLLRDKLIIHLKASLQRDSKSNATSNFYVKQHEALKQPLTLPQI